MYVRHFDEDLAAFRERAPVPPEDRSSLSGKWRKNLRRAADAELAAGRDPRIIRQAVSRLALRVDKFPTMELAEAINDVRQGKPWTPDQQERARRVLGGTSPAIAGDEGAARRRDGYEWLFDREPAESEEEDEAPPDIRTDEEEAEIELASLRRVKFVEQHMRSWRAKLDDKEYGRQVFLLRNAAEKNGITLEDVERLDEQIRAEHADKRAG